MPELPEVETTRRGIAPHLLHRSVRAVRVRQPSLRWPVPAALSRELPGAEVEAVDRRAKYLLLRTGRGTAIVHLGMSGALRIVDEDTPAGRHDHVDWLLDDGHCLRLTDPRRFGAVLWSTSPPAEHPLLARLGPEPLDESFDGDWLYARARKRRAAVKGFIMDSRVVVGLGNIYANEALFRAGIHPSRPAGRVSRARYTALASAARTVLGEAIEQGGTTLRDFVGSDGKPGYFRVSLRVYDHAGDPCPGCGQAIRQRVIAQRSSYFCVGCQR